MMYERPASEQQRFLPETIEAVLKSGISRVAGFLLCTLAALGWLSLLTWSVNDPSPMHATGGPVRNMLGVFGASLSDLMLQTIGLATVLALLAPMLWGVELVVAKSIADFRFKAFLFPPSILLLAGGISALPTPAGWPLRHGLGGFLGDAVLIAATGLVSLVAPRSAIAFAGLALCAGGTGLIVYSVGLSHRAIWELFASGGAAARGVKERVIVSNQSTPHGKEAGEVRLEPILGTITPGGGNMALGNAARVSEPMLPDPAVSGLAGVADVHTVRGMAEATGRAHNQMPPESPLEVRNEITPDPMDEPGADESAIALARRFAPAAAKVQGAGTLYFDSPIDGPAHQEQRARHVAVQASNGDKNPVHSGTVRRHAFPSLNLLRARDSGPSQAANRGAIEETARQLEDVLKDFGVKGEIKDVRPGPVVTVFEFEPQRGTKSQRVIGLAEDIGRSMGVKALRISVVPGRNALGIEVPNVRSETVLLREILETSQFRQCEGSLPIALGKSINGEAVVADLARMPHLLVAGTTGSGKSVGINAMILSLLYRNTPEQCRLLMIDPKMLELSVYNDIPHLLAPVVTDPMKAVGALNWVVGEMEERYKRMAKLGVRNLDGFNRRVREARSLGQPLERCVQTGYDPVSGQAMFETETLDCVELPYIVVVVDEFADLMLVAGKDIEGAVQRLAQMARAAGIHLIMATQRPSVDVITGTIKANFPSRISFKVASKIDSRTILNEQGAEQLLGQGDMLVLAGSGALQRVHGAFVGDDEVEAVAGYLKANGRADYVHGVTEAKAREPGIGSEADRAVAVGGDDLYAQAREIVVRDNKASTSYLQRRLSIGYNRAADLIDRLEDDGVISPQNASGRREVLIDSGGGRVLV